MSERSMQQALNEALAEALAEDPRVLVFGEDVGRHGGVFRVTDDLQRRFGEQRVFDTPLGEAGIVGLAVGLCMQGWRPVVEIQFDGFVFPAFNQIATQISKLRTRTLGAFGLPLTIRVPSYGGIKGPEHHSESVETFVAHLPGIKVVSPSNPAEAQTLLGEAVRDPDPVVFLEPKSRYWARDDSMPSPVGEYASRVVREGADVTLFAWGATVDRCLQSAEFAAEDGVDVQVVDLRWLKPLDVDGISTAAGKTRRAVVVHEAPVTLGLGAELSAVLMERCFGDLLAPVVRVAAPDTPYPSAGLEDEYLPSVDRILLGIQSALDG